ncbi:hypothetical protein TNCV_3199301 [Trichonephila clavipes]|nr:hypothetical protein TNCV_3199301 [Trichonephila clavipes]
MIEYDSIAKALMYFVIPLYSHPETHKDSVGTALHIQEANMDDTTQTKTYTDRAAVGYMTTDEREKSEMFPETSAFISNVEAHVAFL